MRPPFLSSRLLYARLDDSKAKIQAACCSAFSGYEVGPCAAGGLVTLSWRVLRSPLIQSDTEHGTLTQVAFSLNRAKAEMWFQRKMFGHLRTASLTGLSLCPLPCPGGVFVVLSCPGAQSAILAAKHSM